MASLCPPNRDPGAPQEVFSNRIFVLHCFRVIY